MDLVYKLGAGLLLWFSLALGAAPAHAAFPATVDPTACTTAPCYTYTMNVWGTITKSSHAAVCEATATAGSGTDPNYNWQCVSSIPSQGSFQLTRKANGSFFNSQNWPITQSSVSPGAGYTCPANSTLSGSQCTCTPPKVQNSTNDGCTAYVDPDIAVCNDAALVDSAAFGNRDIQIAGKVGTGFVCAPTPGVSAGKGCVVSFTRDVSFQLSGGQWVSEGTYQRPTGAGPCSMDTTSPADPLPAQPDTCKNGQTGQVNGVTVCIPFGGHTPTTSEKKQETVKPSENGPVTTTTNNTTVCDGAGSCTTTTTTNVSVNGGPPTTSTETKSQSKGDFCKENPRSKECGTIGDGASGFGGGCVEGYVGKGDALLKATAEAVNKANCYLNPGTALDPVKDELVAGTFGPALGNTNVTVAQFDQANPFSSSCPPDFSISLGPTLGTHQVPLSQMCTYLALLGYIALAVTLISSTVFVVRGFK